MDALAQEWLRAFRDHPNKFTPIGISKAVPGLRSRLGYSICAELAEQGFLRHLVWTDGRTRYAISEQGRTWLREHPPPPAPPEAPEPPCLRAPETGQMYLRALCEMWLAEDLEVAVAAAAISTMRMKSPEDARRYLRDASASRLPG